MNGEIVLPREICKARGLDYSKEQLAYIMDTMPSDKIIRWCGLNDYIIMAGPPQPMSLVEVTALKPALFYSHYSVHGKWYEKHKFATDKKLSNKWLAIRGVPVLRSEGMPWGQQRQMLSATEIVPNAAEISWLIITFYEVRGIRLFEKTIVRSSDVDDDPRHFGVYLGSFGKHGISISSAWYNWCPSDLGLASSLKLDLVTP